METNLSSSHISKHTRRRKKKHTYILLYLIFFVLLAAISFFLTSLFLSRNKKGNVVATASEIETVEEETSAQIDNSEEEINSLLEKANRLAMSYDYDKAIELLQSDEKYADNERVTSAVSEYENIKTTSVKQNVDEVPHVFFHTLIVDTKKAFDGDSKEAGYNEVMTTMEEFKKMLQSMYDRGFVLVRVHDMAYEVDDGNGGKKMERGSIMLPEGKKPIVMSQDDVCYYEYMVGDGFASRLVIGDDGRVTTEMDMDDGTTQVGDFDLIPVLNKFIDEHPDFSYRGAKAIIAVTGYNGVFGYRTDASYEGKNPNIEEDRKKVTEIAEALRQDGWELASHSWGHKHLGRIEYSHFTTDTDKWENNVESLIGPTDILLYPFGTDVSDWHPYTNTNERYMYLHNKGFRYFCTVDSNKYWVQISGDFFRQGRRNLDGYRMWRDITEPDNPKLSDLFDVNEIFDKARPTPVGVIRS